MNAESVVVRPAAEEDRVALARLLAAVAAERDAIGTEPPVDVKERAARWDLDPTLVAVADGRLVGLLHVDVSRLGFGEIGMMVSSDWRGRGVGSALVREAIDWGRVHGLHKLSLSVFPQNHAAIALYRKFGFVDEGHRVKQVRRDSGELWDLVEMGLLL